MAVIRARKAALVKAGVVGAIVTLIPSLIVCGAMIYIGSRKSAKISDMQLQLSKYTSGTVCVLNTDVEKGQLLTLSDVSLVQGTFYESMMSESIDEYVGKEMVTDAKAGTVLSSLVVAAPKENLDMRTYYVDYVNVPTELTNVGHFDIRISFPNGEDYLVAGNKKINNRDEVGFYVDLTRKEAMMMSSARVDCNIYAGTKLYLALYTTGFENMETETYPVNRYVYSLGQWEPNIEEAFDEEIFLRRETLEANLFEFMGVTNNL